MEITETQVACALINEARKPLNRLIDRWRGIDRDASALCRIDNELLDFHEALLEPKEG